MAITIPHQDHYGMESAKFGSVVGDGSEHRVFYRGDQAEDGWYWLLAKDDEIDTLEKIPFEVLKAEYDEEDARQAEKIRSKGHDCQDYVCHGMYRRENGSLNDYYYCGECDELLQTG
jgi:hypothetical protein